jgi:hypothetical protein
VITEVEFPVGSDREAHDLQRALLARPLRRRGMRVQLRGRWRLFWFQSTAYVSERKAVIVAVVEEPLCG